MSLLFLLEGLLSYLGGSGVQKSLVGIDIP